MWPWRRRTPNTELEDLKRILDEFRASNAALRERIEATAALAVEIDRKIADLKVNAEEREAALLFGGNDVQVPEICH